MKKYSCKKFAQNHRMFETGRNLWMSSGPSPLIKQGHLEPVAHDCVLMGFEYLQGDPLSLGNLCQSLITFTVEVLSDVSVCVHCHWSCLWAPLKKALLCLLCTFSSGIYKIPLPIFYPGWTVPAFSLSSYERCSSPFIIFLALHWTISSSSISLKYLSISF